MTVNKTKVVDRMVLAVEIIVCCLIFGIYRVIRIKRDPAYKISNMPEKLQKKVMHMRGYRNRNIRIMTDWEKFVKKLPALIFWTIALVILTSIAGATSFSTGFVFALLIWMAVLLFLELVVYCGWYAHTPKVWIKGTEDMAKKTYTNYAHYIGLIPQRALMGIVVAIIVGLVIDVIPRLDNNNYSPKYTEIEDTLKAACDNYRIPGMAVEVVDAEGVLFSGTYGECKSLDTPFITGSLSKSFTAACIMKLYEGGHLNIDSPVNPYLDAAEVFKNPKDATRITIRQLLNHTSGLGVYQHVGNAKIVGKNGEYTYANVNYDILGLIVEKVSGVSYSDYLTATFFTPLGMTHSSAAYAKAKKDGLITGHNNYFGFSVESDVKYLQIFSHIICAGCNIARRYSGPRIAERILHIAFHRKTEIIVVTCNQTILLCFCIGCAAVSQVRQAMVWAGYVRINMSRQCTITQVSLRTISQTCICFRRAVWALYSSQIPMTIWLQTI